MYEYGKGSNLLNLTRRNKAGGLIDSLKYGYTITGGMIRSNKLNYVEDKTSNNAGLASGMHLFSYDKDGRLTYDVRWKCSAVSV